MHDLKSKFKRICENSMIRKRHMIRNEDILKQNSNMCIYGAPSLDVRHNIVIEEVPKLGNEAALKAIEDWGQPLSHVTPLIFYTSSCFGNMRGPDYQLGQLLGLKPTVDRLVIFNSGCYGTVLRVAKDVAENNLGSSVLIVRVETMACPFHAPSPSKIIDRAGPLRRWCSCHDHWCRSYPLP